MKLWLNFVQQVKKTGEAQRARDEEIREIAMAYSCAEMNRIANKFRPILTSGFKISELPFVIANLEMTAEAIRKDNPAAGGLADTLKKNFKGVNLAK